MIKTSVFIQIAERYDLEKFMPFILKGTNVHAPYHNFEHTQTVVVEAHTIAMNTPEVAKDKVKIRAILIAALFHDYNHSQGAHIDKFNIYASIEGWEKIAREFGETCIEEVSDLIKCTQYPYEYPEDKLTISHKILRDADMSQTFSSGFMQYVVLGLAKERNISIETSLRNQYTFLSNIKFYTEYSKEHYDGMSSLVRIRQTEVLRFCKYLNIDIEDKTGENV